jgi:glutathione S-transferase
MLIVHHLLASRSERVIWLLEELEIPYELKAYKREPSMAAPAAYRALHPIGTSPILTDGEVTLVETGAIVEYILGKCGEGRLSPAAGTLEHTLYLQWLHYAEGGAAPSILMESMITLGIKGGSTSRRFAAFETLWRDRNERMLPYLEGELAKRPYFAGDQFTAADLMMSYALGLYEPYAGRPLAPHPGIVAYLQKVRARPAYLRAAELAAQDPS